MPLLVTVAAADFQRMAESPAGPVFRRWLAIMARIDATAKRKLSNDMVNVRTGNLRSSQQMPTVVVVAGRIIGSAVNTASYALPVHEGSRAHTVLPKNKKVLTGWSYQGQPVFTPVGVNIPAQPARPWLRDSVREVLATTR